MLPFPSTVCEHAQVVPYVRKCFGFMNVAMLCGNFFSQFSRGKNCPTMNALLSDFFKWKCDCTSSIDTNQEFE